MRYFTSYVSLMALCFLLGFTLYRVLPADQLPLLAVILPSFINLTLWWIESFAPYRRDWKPPKRLLVRDILVTSLVLPLFSGLSLTLIQYLQLKLETGNPLAAMPFWAQFVVLAFATDFTYYWFHRMSHQMPFFWRFHHLHHSVKQVYWANSGFFHPLDAFLQSLFYFIPFLFIKADPLLVTTLLAFSAVTGALEHANVELRSGQLTLFFNPAELHRWHHAREAKFHNRNFGKAFIFWDRIFGTYLNRANAKSLEVGA